MIRSAARGADDALGHGVPNTRLGTLGFSERVAREMVLGRGLFTECRVLYEADNTRWFEVTR